MPKRPPLIPAESLRRVLRVARLDGSCILAVAGLFALASASIHDTAGAAVGLLVAGTGAIELHGTGLLRNREERGMKWLVASQLFLMAIVLAYVASRLMKVDLSILQPLVTADQRKAIADAGLTIEEFLRIVYVGTYAVFGVVTVLYQGGMTAYYLRRRSAVAAALAEPADKDSI